MTERDGIEDVRVADWFQRVMLPVWLGGVPKPGAAQQVLHFLTSLTPATSVNDLRGRNLQIARMLSVIGSSEASLAFTSSMSLQEKVTHEATKEVVTEACERWMPLHFRNEGCACADYAVRAMKVAIWAAEEMARPALKEEWNTVCRQSDGQGPKLFIRGLLSPLLQKLGNGPAR